MRPVQLLAIREQDLNDASDGVAVLDLQYCHADLIPDFDGVLRPAGIDHGGRIFGLHHPMYRFAAIIRHVQLKHTMGIGPSPLCNGTLHCDSFLGVICRVAVVCEQREGNNRSAYTQSKNYPEFAFQESPLLFWNPGLRLQVGYE